MKKHSVKIGNIFVGGDHPIMVQSMTNTDTAEIDKTVNQIKALADAGSECVRVTVNNNESAAAIAPIKEKLLRQNYTTPIIGDFHFNGHKLLKKHPECAEFLDKYRINPGNVGKGKSRDAKFYEMIEIACQYNKPVRIGVNWGSLDQSVLANLLDNNSALATPLPLSEINKKAVIQSALDSAQMAEHIGLGKDQIIISCKMSRVPDLIDVYEQLNVQSDYALHLGLTEAGMGSKGIVSSTAALSVLLRQNIGNTIRISLTPEPGEARTKEVQVAQEILQSLDLRSFTPSVVSCPGCGRTSSDYFQILAKDIQQQLTSNMLQWKNKHPGVEKMNVAIMGCVVNGPGESKHANIGISLPGTGELPVAPVYEDGKKTVTLKGDSIATEFMNLVDQYVARTYTS